MKTIDISKNSDGSFEIVIPAMNQSLENWVANLRENEYDIHTSYEEGVLKKMHNKGQVAFKEQRVLIIPLSMLEEEARTKNHIGSLGQRKGYSPLTPGVELALLEQLNKDDFGSMNLSNIIMMHEPVLFENPAEDLNVRCRITSKQALLVSDTEHNTDEPLSAKFGFAFTLKN